MIDPRIEVEIDPYPDARIYCVTTKISDCSLLVKEDGAFKWDEIEPHILEAVEKCFREIEQEVKGIRSTFYDRTKTIEPRIKVEIGPIRDGKMYYTIKISYCSLLVRKGPASEWDEIKPHILEAMKKYFREIEQEMKIVRPTFLRRLACFLQLRWGRRILRK